MEIDLVKALCFRYGADLQDLADDDPVGIDADAFDRLDLESRPGQEISKVFDREIGFVKFFEPA